MEEIGHGATSTVHLGWDRELERESLQDKGDLFADVIGLPVVIKQKPMAV